MTNLYPPVLEDRGNAIPELAAGIASNYTIYFNLPNMVNRADIQHIQVVLKYKDTGASAVNEQFSPDRATLFLETIPNAGGYMNTDYFYEVSDNLYALNIPYQCFDGMAPKRVQTYTAQVRFGSNPLWLDSTGGGANPGWAKDHFESYAQWRKLAISNVPSAFGEWSNTQSVFCFSRNIGSALTYDLLNFVPTLHWSYYDEEDTDPIQQVKVTYSHSVLNGTSAKEVIDTLVINGHEPGSGNFTYDIELPIAPVAAIDCFIEAVTKNNVVLSNTCTVYPITFNSSALDNNQKAIFELADWQAKELTPVVLTGEEMDDGIIAKTYGYTDEGGIAHSYIQDLIDLEISKASVYRINIFDFSTIKLFDFEPLLENPIIKIKDYTVEMGEEYMYFIFGQGNGLNNRSVSYHANVGGYDYDTTVSGLVYSTPADAAVFRPDIMILATWSGTQYITTNNNTINTRKAVLPDANTKKNGYGYVYADTAANNGMYRSTDDGTGNFVWVQLTEDVDYRVKRLFEYDPAYTYYGIRNPNHLYYRSTDGIKYSRVTNNFKALYGLTKLFPYNDENGGYGRLMRMDASYLTTKFHQLRLQGDMKISSFKRNTQDQFQDTIGGKYPYYNRLAKRNYRTFSVNALISINLDPTSTFLRLNKDLGLEWVEDSDNKQVIIYNNDLFTQQEISLSRRRDLQKKSQGESIRDLEQPIHNNRNDQDFYKTDTLPGPKTIFDDYLYKQDFLKYGPDREDTTVYVERKYRDLVMEWLSDGKPKLYRSETEGNMIVMLSDITFSPYSGNNRIVYSVSFKCTEIADYNLQNLIEYQLVPTEIIVDYNAVDLYKFNRGQLDPNLLDKITMHYDAKFNIPNTEIGKQIAPIDLSSSIINKDGDLEFYFVQDDGTEVTTLYGFTINNNGIITGSPTIVANPDLITIKVKDLGNLTENTMAIQHGIFYNPLKADTTLTLPSIALYKPGDPEVSINVNNTGANTYWLDGYLAPGSHYHFNAKDLPFGLTISDDGIISGKFLSTLAPGQFTVICEDDLGNITSLPMTHNGSIGPLVFNKLSGFEVAGGEITTAITEINFADGVYGGSGPYRFSATGLPTGLTLNTTTGVLTGTRTNVIPAGSFTVTVRDATGSTQTITVPYGAFVEILNFVNEGTAFDIPATLVGTVVNSFSVLSQECLTLPVAPKTNALYWFPNAIGAYTPGTYIWDGTNFVLKSANRLGAFGGYPFEVQPYYTFKAIGLAPNYKIDNYGVISGTVLNSVEAHTATLQVFDSRGDNTPIKQITIQVGAVTPTLSYTGGVIHDVYYAINAGQKFTGTTWTLQYTDFQDGTSPVSEELELIEDVDVTGNKISSLITSVYDPTDLTASSLTITLDEALMACARDTLVYYTVRGRDTGKTVKVAISLKEGINPAFRFGGTSNPSQRINGTIVGDVVDDLIELGVTQPFTGGVLPYRVCVDNPDDLNGLIFEPITRNVGTGTTQLFRLLGTIKEPRTNNSTIKVYVVDQLGQRCSDGAGRDYFELVWNEIYPKLTIKPFVNRMTNSANITSAMSDTLQRDLCLIIGKTNLSPQLQIVIAEGGTGQYQFEVMPIGSTTYSSTFNNGLAFPTGFGDANSGILIGNVTTPYERTNYGARFKVTDSAGHVAFTDPEDIWYMPRTSEDIEFVNNIYITGLHIGSTCNSDPMFDVHEVPHSFLGYTYVPTSNPEHVLPTAIKLNTASYENMAGLVQAASGQVTTFKYTLTRTHQPDDEYGWITDGTSVVASVTFDTISGNLYIDSINDVVMKEIEVGAYFTADLNSAIWYGGGNGDQLITFTTLPAGISQIDTNNPLMIGGTPIAPSGQQTITVTITDELGDTQSTTILFPAIKKTVSFDPSASVSIPEHRAGEDIGVIVLNNFLLANTGVAPFFFSFGTDIEDYGYKIQRNGNNFELVGKAITEKPAVNATIKVSDFYAMTASMIIPVGATYATLQVGGIAVPPGPALSPMVTIELNSYVHGGKAPYTWAPDPSYSPTTVGTITTFTVNGITWHLDSSNNTLYMDGNIRPNAVIDQHDLLFTVTDSPVNGATVTSDVTIRVGKVVAAV